MNKPTKLIFNCETQEQTIVEMTDAEYEQYLLDISPVIEEDNANS